MYNGISWYTAFDAENANYFVSLDYQSHHQFGHFTESCLLAEGSRVRTYPSIYTYEDLPILKADFSVMQDDEGIHLDGTVLAADSNHYSFQVIEATNALTEVADDTQSVQPTKILQNGRLSIIRRDQKYSLTGLKQ